MSYTVTNTITISDGQINATKRILNERRYDRNK